MTPSEICEICQWKTYVINNTLPGFGYLKYSNSTTPAHKVSCVIHYIQENQMNREHCPCQTCVVKACCTVQCKEKNMFMMINKTYGTHSQNSSSNLRYANSTSWRP